MTSDFRTLTTVAELLKAVGRVTRLDLRADMRCGTLPTAVRTRRGGQTVPAIDILKALTRSVSGTFRRLNGGDGSITYLLTDDVIGYGTRLARLNDQGDGAYRVREEALAGAAGK